ncbi:MAG: hypothetical protein K2L82_14070 [Lachnospiraceae bacterium]|nr:hypothetical protein [Lachnospiraceae bacterium]
MRKCSGYYNKYSYDSGKSEKIEFENAIFHAFGVDWEDVGDGVGLFTTAVIELQDGTMLNLPVANIKFTSPEYNRGSDCLTVETDDSEHFREQIKSYTAEGYSVSSTGCVYGRWQAILIKEAV